MIRLADGGLIEIGSHTLSHPVLAALPVAAQIDEISGSKARLEQLLGHPVTSFAYPFGGRSHYTDQTVAAVREAGFEWACSNFAGMVWPSTDRWQLPRLLVRDWDGDQFARNLEGWIRDA
jgi:peptidoglycan/xylan/chitin deacetylase (PgdA/CDA1 family)